jgi:trimethylguanosine synthase
VVDCFSGVGGNTIQVTADSSKFACNGSQVVSLELDSSRLAMAKKNAEIYGVADKIEWIEGDMLKAEGVRGDVVFMSPPWGGTGYMALDYYSIFR